MRPSKGRFDRSLVRCLEWPTMRRVVRRSLRAVRNYLGSTRVRRCQTRTQRGDQRSVLVVAPRRSGHHAIINWIVNGLEGQQVNWTTILPPGSSNKGILLRSTIGGTTLHFNDLPSSRKRYKASACLPHLDLVRQAKFVIASYEDVEAAALDRGPWLPRHPTFKVLVTRSTLNLMASRLERRAALPNTQVRPIDTAFLDGLLSNSKPPEGWVVIRFDDWLSDPSPYRDQIARQLGMKIDLSAELSPFGSGSSFSGLSRVPTSDELTSRFRQVEWPSSVVELLLEPKYRPLLTDIEYDFLVGLKV